MLLLKYKVYIVVWACVNNTNTSLSNRNTRLSNVNENNYNDNNENYLK